MARLDVYNGFRVVRLRGAVRRNGVKVWSRDGSAAAKKILDDLAAAAAEKGEQMRNGIPYAEYMRRAFARGKARKRRRSKRSA